MRNFLKVLLVIITLALGISSCQKSLDPGATTTPKASNGWWVTYSSGGSALTNYVFFNTYSTAENKTDSMFVDDLGQGFWDFNGKVALNYSALTFSNPYLVNTAYGNNDTINIFNGKILPKAGHSKTGVVTDSLYFEFTWSDDPYSGPYADTIVVSGTARTGFINDDY